MRILPDRFYSTSGPELPIGRAGTSPSAPDETEYERGYRIGWDNALKWAGLATAAAPVVLLDQPERSTE